VILLGIALTAVQLAVSIRERRLHSDRTGDPWNGRTLEWSMPSPPPAWNFTQMPNVGQTDAYWHIKQEGSARAVTPGAFADMHVPRNSPVGIFLAFFAVILGFALIWRIEWLAAIGLIGAVVVVLREAWQTDLEVRIPAAEVAAFEHAHAVRVPGTGGSSFGPDTATSGERS
jgi:cytochrome o ubiquinol oxidase subunit 1